MSIYSAADEKNGTIDRFASHGDTRDSEKQVLRKNCLEARKQIGKDSDEVNASGMTSGSIANMERIDYLTLLAEQMNM